MADVQEKRPTTVHGLVNTIDDFITSNRHSRDVELRWFASYMEEPLRIARQLRSGGLDEAERASVSVFRLHEIEAAKEQRRKEIDELDREAAKLNVA